MIRIVLMSAIALGLAACASVPGTEPAQPPIVDRTGDTAPACAAGAYQVLVGQLIGEVHTESLPEPNRIYGQGDMITMDYRPDRLNVIVGDDGRVAEVRCG